MAWRVVGTIYPMVVPGSHTVNVLWRDDDPYGALWRAIGQLVAGVVPAGWDPHTTFPLARIVLTMTHTVEEKVWAESCPDKRHFLKCLPPGQLPPGVKF